VPFGSEGLVVTWSIPVPKTAKVVLTNDEVFDAVDRVTGAEVPENFPKKYTEKQHKSEVFNPSLLWDNSELNRVQARHGIQMEREPSAVFEQYFRTNHAVVTTLASHPRVPDPARWAICDIILQRGVIVMDPSPVVADERDPGAQGARPAGGRLTVIFRSHFHSAKDDQSYVNFVPRGGVEASFASDTIWFPLELTRFLKAPSAHVVLDILTAKPLEAGRVPKPFRLEKTGRMEYRGKTYSVSRITADLAANQRWPDLRIKP